MESPQEGMGGGKAAGTQGMKRCSYCGAKNKDSFEYCVRCSESLDGSGSYGFTAERRSPLLTIVGGAVVLIVALGVTALLIDATPDGPETTAPGGTRNAPPIRPLVPRVAPILEGVEPAEIMAKYHAGLAAYRAGDYDEAILNFEEVVRDLPENPAVHQYLGLAYYHSGNLEDAKQALGDARGLRPHSFELLDHYVTVCKEDNDVEGAIDALSSYVSSNPSELEARLELVRLARESGNMEIAMNQAQFLASEENADPEFVYEYGVSLKESGQLEEAKDVLRTSLELDPESAVAHHALGVTELITGNAQKAVTSLEAAVARAPSNGDFHFSLAQAYEKLDRIPESLAAYEAYLENARPDDTKATVVRRQLELAKKAWAAEREREREARRGQSL